MLIQLLLIALSAGWAIGCVALREAEGRWSVLVVWAIVIAVLAVMSGVSSFKALPLRADPERIAELAKRFDVTQFEAHEKVDAERFPFLKEIVLPGYHQPGPQNRTEFGSGLAGRIDEAELLVVDVQRAPTSNDTAAEPETIVVFPSLSARLPNFNLERAPRVSLLTAGTLKFDKGAIEEPDRGQLKLFERSYRILPLGEAHEPLLEVFTLDTITYLAVNPGWTINAHGGHLVLARRGRRASGADLAGFLAEADAIRRQLLLPPGPDRSVLPEYKQSLFSLRWLFEFVVTTVGVAAIFGFLGGVLGFVAGMVGMCFSGNPFTWALEGCYLGTAFGPAFLMAVALVMTPYFALRRQPIESSADEQPSPGPG